MINSIKRTFGDKTFLKTAMALIIPISLQSLLMSGVNFLDNIMIGRLGEASIAAVSLANQYYFVLNLVLFGVCSGAGIFISQFWGKGDIPNIRKVFIINVLAGGVVALLFMLIGVFAPDLIMKVFTTDAEVIKLGISYITIIVISYIPTSVSMALQIGLKSVGRTKIPLLMSFIALCMNGVLNYILIFGKLGAPAMGITGAAIATSITRIIEMILTFILLSVYSPDLRIRINDFMGFTSDFLKHFSNVCTPVVVNEFFWGLGTCLYSFVYGRMGTDTVAAVSISTTIENLMSIFMFGMANAGVVMIGTKIGEGDIETGKDYSTRFSVMSIVLGALMCVSIICVAPVILNLFKVELSVRNTAFWVLADIAFISILRSYVHTGFIGSLRSGGDTRFCLIIDLAGVWGISLPLLIIFGLILKVPIEFTYMTLAVEQIIKTVLISKRLKSGKWIKNLVKDM